MKTSEMETSEPKNFLYDTLLPKMERIGWLLTILGLGLHYAVGYKAVKLLNIGLLTLAVVYFLVAFRPVARTNDATGQFYSATEPSGKSFLANVVTPKIQGQAMAITLIGILFKISFIQGSAILLQVGILSLLVAVAIQLAASNLNRPAAIVLLLGAVVWATPLATLVQQAYRHNPVLMERAFYSLRHPEDRAAAEEVRRLRKAR